MSDYPTLGEIRLFSGTYLPRGWLPCNGNPLSLSQNAALYSLLGTQFGGNGTNNFALPNLPPVVANGNPLLYGLAAYGSYTIPDNPVDGMIGVIQPWPMLRMPSNWMPCDGRTLSAQDYPELVEVIGTRFGGNGTTTVQLPNIAPIPSAGGAAVPYWICVSGFFPSDGGGVFLDYYSRVFAWAGRGTPAGTLPAAANQTLQIRQYQPLFVLLGTRYGGNGTTQFNLPDVPPLVSGAVNIPHRIFVEGIFPESA
jgi:microcystin-dependent protein